MSESVTFEEWQKGAMSPFQPMIAEAISSFERGEVSPVHFVGGKCNDPTGVKDFVYLLSYAGDLYARREGRLDDHDTAWLVERSTYGLDPTKPTCQCQDCLDWLKKWRPMTVSTPPDKTAALTNLTSRQKTQNKRKQYRAKKKAKRNLLNQEGNLDVQEDPRSR